MRRHSVRAKAEEVALQVKELSYPECGSEDCSKTVPVFSIVAVAPFEGDLAERQVICAYQSIRAFYSANVRAAIM